MVVPERAKLNVGPSKNYDKLFEALSIKHEKITDQSIVEYCDLLRSLSNIDVIIQCYSYQDQNAVKLFVHPLQLIENNFINYLLNHPIVQDTLPESFANNKITPETFKYDDKYPQCFCERLSIIVIRGGVYTSYEGSHIKAKELADKVCEAMFGHRYKDILIFCGNTAWSAWFPGIIWDESWIIVDKMTLKIWILFMNDTD